MAYDCFYTTKKTVKQGIKNIFIKILKDIGMTVPKSRETSVVYICRNTGNEGTIFICGMRACNNNNMRNPSLHLFHYGVMHVIIVACLYVRAQREEIHCVYSETSHALQGSSTCFRECMCPSFLHSK